MSSFNIEKELFIDEIPNESNSNINFVNQTIIFY